MVEEHIDVTVRLRNALSRPADKAEESVEDLRDSVHELNASLEDNEKQTKRNERALGALRDASGRFAKQTDSTSKSTDRQSKSQKALAANTAAARNQLGKLNKGMLALGNILKIVLFTGLISALPLAAQGLSALAAGGYAAVAGLSPLVGLLVAVPQVLAAAGVGIGSVILGLSGMGDAIKALLDPAADPAKIAEAMSKLTVEGQQLARVTSNLVQGPLQNLKNATQDALSPGLVIAVRELRGLFPTLNTAMVASATTMGDLAADAGKVASSPMFTGQLATIMASNNRALDDGARGAGSLVLAMLDLLEAATPVTEAMALSTRGVGEFIAAATDDGLRSGGLTTFFREAWELGKDVGRVIADLAVGLFNVGRGADEAAAALGGSLADRVAQFRAWTESLAGESAIKKWFADSLPVLSAFSRLIFGLSNGFAKLAAAGDLAPVIDQVNRELGPAFSDLSSGLSDEVIPALVDAATAAVKFIDVVASSPLPAILATMASGVLAIATALDSLPEPVKFVIASVLALTAAIRIMQFTAAGSKLAFAPLLSVGSQIKTGIQAGVGGASASLGTLARAADGARGGLMGARMAASGLLASMGGLGGVAVMGVVVGLGLLFSAMQKQKQAQEELKAKADALTATFDQQTGAITDNTRAMVAKDLQDSGMLDNAERLGISTKTLTDAVMGNSAAMAQVERAMVGLPFDATQTSVENLRKAFSEEEVQSILSARAATQLKDVLPGLQAGFQGSAADAKQLASAVYGVGSQSKGSMTGILGSADALERQAAAADKSKASLKALNDYFLSQQRTLIGFRQNVHDASETLKANKKTMDINTQAGRDNRLALMDVAEAASAVTNEAQRTKAIKEASKFIRQWADDAGMGAGEAKRYADNMFKLAQEARGLPPTASVNVVATGVEQALSDIKAVGNAIAGINSMRVAPRRPAPSITQVENSTPTTSTTEPGVGTSETERRRNRNRRLDGGSVDPGVTYRIGEAGPELLLSAAGVSVIGGAGEQTRRFAEPGMVLPNSTYEAVTAAPAAPRELAYAGAPPRVHTGEERASSSAVPDEVPELHNHFHGDAAPTAETMAMVEEAALRAWRKWDRERKERGGS